MSRCETLEGYATLIKMIRDNRAAGMSLDEAVTRAVDECIKKGILKKYLMQNKTEVHDMILYEFDQKAHDKIMYEDGKEDERITNIKSIMRKLGMPAQKAMDVLNIAPSEQAKYLPQLQN